MDELSGQTGMIVVHQGSHLGENDQNDQFFVLCSKSFGMRDIRYVSNF